MIRFCTGVPGSGKTNYTVIQLERVLRLENRAIITNAPVKIEPWARGGVAQLGLREFLRSKGDSDCEVGRRVHILQDEEVPEFMCYRVVDGKLVKFEPERDDKGKILSVRAINGTEPVVYLLDEAWKFFGARDWQKTSVGVQWYMAQHRKFGDDVWITTQHFNQVDKQLRLLVGEYHECINHLHRKLFLFRHPGVISVNVSNDPPERQGRLLSEQKVIRYDRTGIMSCYDTAAGSGVQGSVADLGRRPAGLPWWTAIIGMVLIGAVVYFVPDLVARGATRGERAKLAAKRAAQVSATNAVPVGSAVLEIPGRSGAPGVKRDVELAPAVSVTRPLPPVTDEGEVIYMTGRALLPDGRVVVMLSDGRIVGAVDGLQALGPDCAVVAGQVFRWRPVKSIASVWSSASPAATVSGSGGKPFSGTAVRGGNWSYTPNRKQHPVIVGAP